jgi:hypothetical protein
MNFQRLEANLRKLLWARISAGELTGLKLAEQTGFRQAHISNFLNGKRGLSLEGMDRVLVAQRLSVVDLVDGSEISRRLAAIAGGGDGFDNVVLVDAVVAATQPQIASDQVRDVLKYKKNFLRRLRPEAVTMRSAWQRFVLFKVDGNAGMGMYPRLITGATVLVDRHYNSLKPYHRNERNMYAVRVGRDCTVRYVEVSGSQMVLRPHNDAYPVKLLPIEKGKSYAEYIVGRVCHMGIET